MSLLGGEGLSASGKGGGGGRDLFSEDCVGGTVHRTK